MSVLCALPSCNDFIFNQRYHPLTFLVRELPQNSFSDVPHRTLHAMRSVAPFAGANTRGAFQIVKGWAAVRVNRPRGTPSFACFTSPAASDDDFPKRKMIAVSGEIARFERRSQSPIRRMSGSNVSRLCCYAPAVS